MRKEEKMGMCGKEEERGREEKEYYRDLGRGKQWKK